jgi:dephospho-CoA kinase
VVNKTFEDFLCKNKEAIYVVKEAAILIESGAYKQVDKIIVVTAPIIQRVQRVVKRDNISEQEVHLRINKQLPQDDLIKYAHYIVNNEDGSMLLPQIIEINKLILNEIK